MKIINVKVAVPVNEGLILMAVRYLMYAWPEKPVNRKNVTWAIKREVTNRGLDIIEDPEAWCMNGDLSPEQEDEAKTMATLMYQQILN